MTGRILRWIATHRPATSIARWVEKVRLETVSFRMGMVDVGPETEPSMFGLPPSESELAELRDAGPEYRAVLARVTAICGGASPSDLPRGR